MREIRISNYIPAKKNRLKLTHNGRGYYDAETRQRLDEINAEVADQWGSRNADGSWSPWGPLLHPAFGVVFYCATQRSDRDNQWTTIQDALVAGGVLKEDCIKYNNGTILIGQAYETPTGIWGARVFIEESGSFDRMLQYFRNADLQDYSWLKLGKAKKRKAPTRTVRPGGLARVL